MKKYFLFLFFLFSVSVAFSLSVSGTLQVDTYGDMPSVGFSFSAQDELFPSINIYSMLEYAENNSYETKFIVLGSYKIISLGSGIGIDFNTTPQAEVMPGFIPIIKLGNKKKVDIEFSAFLPFVRNYETNIYGFSAQSLLRIHTENSLTYLQYSAKRISYIDAIENSVLIHAYLFEKAFPFSINVGSRLTVPIFFESTSQNIDIKLSVLLGYSFSLKRHGTYFMNNEILLFSLKQGKKFPFKISVGTSIDL